MIPTNPAIPSNNGLIDSYWRIAEYQRRVKDLYRFLELQLGYGRIRAHPVVFPD